MTVVGAGGIRITELAFKKKFKRDYKKLTESYQRIMDSRLQELLMDPIPERVKFEKLQGFRKPSLWTGHLDGNYKFSFEIEGSKCILRRVSNHDSIDRSP